MREGTRVTVFTLGDGVWIRRAEFRLVAFGVVEVLHTVVGAGARVAQGTLFAASPQVSAHFRRVAGGQAPSILLLCIVMVHALLEAVIRFECAWLSFKLQ